MPYITFMWHPKSDEWRVGPIVDDLRTIADELNIGFYVTPKEEGEEDRVVIADDLTLSGEVVERLRLLAERVDVTIYVTLPDDPS